MNSRVLPAFPAPRAVALGVLCALALAACGGGGGSGGGGTSSGGTSGNGGTGTLSGTVTKGPVSGATVRAYAIDGGMRGRQLGSASTDASGNFTLTMSAYSGPMMLEVHGGTYHDEATGQHMTLLDGDPLTCALPTVTVTNGSSTTGIQVTPLTSMAQSWAQHMAGGMTDVNITAANGHVGTGYLGMGVDIVMTHPIDPGVVGSANGASMDSTSYGMLLAAMSQAAHDLGMVTSSSGMVTAMMDDASDGVMDGRMGGMTIDMGGMGGMMGGHGMMSTTGTSQLATSMSEFIANLTMNRSGIVSSTDMQPMLDRLNQLAASGGRL